MVRVWDICVRFTHWIVALGFFVAYLTEDEALPLHVWAGYVVGVLVFLRILWGFIGTKHARFTDFVFGPRKVISYLLDLVLFRAERYLGHNPAGGAMTIALWVGLLAVVWSGLELYAVEEGAGPLAAVSSQADQVSSKAPDVLVLVRSDDDDENKSEDKQESAWEDIHEALSNFVLLLVLLHIAGVTLASLVHRENLPRSMVTGMKRKK
jgi:cytochrome b